MLKIWRTGGGTAGFRFRGKEVGLARRMESGSRAAAGRVNSACLPGQRRQPEINKRTRHLDDASTSPRPRNRNGGLPSKNIPTSRRTLISTVWLCSVAASKAKDKQSRRFSSGLSLSLSLSLSFFYSVVCTHTSIYATCTMSTEDFQARFLENLFDDPRTRGVRTSRHSMPGRIPAEWNVARDFPTDVNLVIVTLARVSNFSLCTLRV